MTAVMMSLGTNKKYGTQNVKKAGPGLEGRTPRRGVVIKHKVM